jgi:hypothetical protein
MVLEDKDPGTSPMEGGGKKAARSDGVMLVCGVWGVESRVAGMLGSSAGVICACIITSAGGSWRMPRQEYGGTETDEGVGKE